MLSIHMGVKFNTVDVVSSNDTEVLESVITEKDDLGAKVDVFYDNDHRVADIGDIATEVTARTTLQCSVTGCKRKYIGLHAARTKCAVARVRAM